MAEDGRVSARIPMLRQITTTVINRVVDRKRIADWASLDIGESSRGDYLCDWLICSWLSDRRLRLVGTGSVLRSTSAGIADIFTRPCQRCASGLRRICIRG